MENRKDSKKTTPEPKKTNKDEVELQVEELEERIAPAALWNKNQ